MRDDGPLAYIFLVAFFVCVLVIYILAGERRERVPLERCLRQGQTTQCEQYRGPLPTCLPLPKGGCVRSQP